MSKNMSDCYKGAMDWAISKVEGNEGFSLVGTLLLNNSEMSGLKVVARNDEEMFANAKSQVTKPEVLGFVLVGTVGLMAEGKKRDAFLLYLQGPHEDVVHRRLALYEKNKGKVAIVQWDDLPPLEESWLLKS